MQDTDDVRLTPEQQAALDRALQNMRSGPRPASVFEPPPKRKRPGHRPSSEEVDYSGTTVVSPLSANSRTKVEISNHVGGISMSEEKTLWDKVPWQAKGILGAGAIALFLTGMNKISAPSEQDLVIADHLMSLQERQIVIDERRTRLKSTAVAPAPAMLQIARPYECETIPKLYAGFEGNHPQVFASGFQVPKGCAVVEVSFPVRTIEGSGYEIRLPDPSVPRNFFETCLTPAECVTYVNRAGASTDRRILIIMRGHGYVKFQP